MPVNIPLWRRAGVLLAAILAPIGTSSAVVQKPCPPEAATAVAQAWQAYRGDSLEAAAKRFGQAERLCPGNLDALVGLGFTHLRQDRLPAADSLFRRVLARDTANADAWEGRARVAYRRGNTADAATAARRSLALTPGNSELRALLDRISPDWERPGVRPKKRPAKLQLVARTRDRGFEISTANGWKPFYIQGVNMGVALPGKYPSEFPADSARYAGWLDTLAGMHANTLRLYTILPPAFYRALRAWNTSNPKRTFWLIHGVWTELPLEDQFDDPQWEGEFQTEMRRVVDLIHGSTTIPVRPGHAGGRYDADVSPWTLGYIIGREWEPFAVKAFDEQRPNSRAYRGRYLAVADGRAMDVWLARQCDYLLSYEVNSYNALRPIAYTNWPTLDPLTHPTESTTSEEAYWRRRSGRPTDAKKLEYDNDAIGLDANLVRPTAANPAGWFASYHAYPYYPDFMILDPGYLSARSSEGPSNYFGYLRDLVTHHAGIPTVISEYGVPSSRGMAHLHPQGWSHGGHDEQDMARVDARLTREIREAGGAGAILFAWLDEWFKKNWVVIDFEIPLDHTRKWHNVMDAEQNYGILGQYAGDAESTPQLGGDPERWRALSAIQRSSPAAGKAPRALRAGADESYFYLAVELEPGRFGWDSLGIQLAIDTYLPAVGQHRLPRSGARSEIGFEFLVDLAGPDSGRIGVIPDYNRHESKVDPVTGDDAGRFYRRPIVTIDRQDARFDSLFVITNRARFGRDGTFFPAQGYDRGRLRHGTEARSTLSDWYLDERAGLLELRIAWDLLNVTDPSTRTLLFDPELKGDFGTAMAEDFHVGAVIYRKGGNPAVVGALPALGDGGWRSGAFTKWRWAGWSEPRSHARLKPVYDSLKALWAPAPAGAPAQRAQRAP